MAAKKKTRKILYVCDRRACPACTYPKCHLTTDVTHAKYFVTDAIGQMVELDDTNPQPQNTQPIGF